MIQLFLNLKLQKIEIVHDASNKIKN